MRSDHDLRMCRQGRSARPHPSPAARSGRDPNAGHDASRSPNGWRTVRFPLVINPGPVQYKGGDLDAERGPGLGCFRFQLVVLAVFVVLTPLTVVWQWPAWISAVLLFAIIALLLVTGQTIIFLLRLVAADRRSRRRPLASATKTVGELDDEQARRQADPPPTGTRTANDATTLPSDEGPVRQ